MTDIQIESLVLAQTSEAISEDEKLKIEKTKIEIEKAKEELLSLRGKRNFLFLSRETWAQLIISTATLTAGYATLYKSHTNQINIMEKQHKNSLEALNQQLKLTSEQFRKQFELQQRQFDHQVNRANAEDKKATESNIAYSIKMAFTNKADPADRVYHFSKIQNAIAILSTAEIDAIIKASSTMALEDDYQISTFNALAALVESLISTRTNTDINIPQLLFGKAPEWGCFNWIQHKFAIKDGSARITAHSDDPKIAFVNAIISSNKTKFQRVTLSRFDMAYIDLSRGNYSWAQFHNSYMRNALLVNTILVGADFNSADLSGADLSNSDINNVNFYNTNLGYCNLYKTTGSPANFKSREEFIKDISNRHEFVEMDPTSFYQWRSNGFKRPKDWKSWSFNKFAIDATGTPITR